MEFFAAPMDTPRLLEKLAEHAPRNPFCSPGFFKAMRRSGSDPWIAGMRKEDQLLRAAGVFLRRGRLNSTLEITSLPTAAGNEEFWCGLFRFSAVQRVALPKSKQTATPRRRWLYRCSNTRQDDGIAMSTCSISLASASIACPQITGEISAKQNLPA